MHQLLDLIVLELQSRCTLGSAPQHANRLVMTRLVMVAHVLLHVMRGCLRTLCLDPMHRFEAACVGGDDLCSSTHRINALCE